MEDTGNQSVMEVVDPLARLNTEMDEFQKTMREGVVMVTQRITELFQEFRAKQLGINTNSNNSATTTEILGSTDIGASLNSISRSVFQSSQSQESDAAVYNGTKSISNCVAEEHEDSTINLSFQIEDEEIFSESNEDCNLIGGSVSPFSASQGLADVESEEGHSIPMFVDEDEDLELLNLSFLFDGENEEIVEIPSYFFAEDEDSLDFSLLTPSFFFHEEDAVDIYYKSHCKVRLSPIFDDSCLLFDRGKCTVPSSNAYGKLLFRMILNIGYDSELGFMRLNAFLLSNGAKFFNVRNLFVEMSKSEARDMNSDRDKFFLQLIKHKELVWLMTAKTLQLGIFCTTAMNHPLLRDCVPWTLIDGVFCSTLHLDDAWWLFDRGKCSVILSFSNEELILEVSLQHGNELCLRRPNSIVLELVTNIVSYAGRTRCLHIPPRVSAMWCLIIGFICFPSPLNYIRCLFDSGKRVDSPLFMQMLPRNGTAKTLWNRVAVTVQATLWVDTLPKWVIMYRNSVASVGSFSPTFVSYGRLNGVEHAVLLRLQHCVQVRPPSQVEMGSEAATGSFLIELLNLDFVHFLQQGCHLYFLLWHFIRLVVVSVEARDGFRLNVEMEEKTRIVFQLLWQKFLQDWQCNWCYLLTPYCAQYSSSCSNQVKMTATCNASFSPGIWNHLHVSPIITTALGSMHMCLENDSAVWETVSYALPDSMRNTRFLFDRGRMQEPNFWTVPSKSFGESYTFAFHILAYYTEMNVSDWISVVENRGAESIDVWHLRIHLHTTAVRGLNCITVGVLFQSRGQWLTGRGVRLILGFSSHLLHITTQSILWRARNIAADDYSDSFEETLQLLYRFIQLPSLRTRMFSRRVECHVPGVPRILLYVSP